MHAQAPAQAPASERRGSTGVHPTQGQVKSSPRPAYFTDNCRCGAIAAPGATSAEDGIRRWPETATTVEILVHRKRLAETVVAFLGDPHRFDNARQVSAYAGLVPRQHQSGTMNRHGRITRRGPRLLRSMLVEVAWLAVRHNDWATGIVAHLSQGAKGRRRQAIVALARKLLVRLWAMLRDGTNWKHPTQGASERVRGQQAASSHHTAGSGPPRSLAQPSGGVFPSSSDL